MGKSCGLKKVEKKGEKCPFNVLRCKSCKKKKKKKKRVGTLAFVINIKETVPQVCFHLTFCAVKAAKKKKKKKKKRVGSLSFVINMKETVKQLCFNFQGCEFRGLITVRSCL